MTTFDVALRSFAFAFGCAVIVATTTFGLFWYMAYTMQKWMKEAFPNHRPDQELTPAETEAWSQIYTAHQARATAYRLSGVALAVLSIPGILAVSGRMWKGAPMAMWRVLEVNAVMWFIASVIFFAVRDFTSAI
jgi:hypothetical protein